MEVQSQQRKTFKPFNIISSTQNSLDRYKFIASCILQTFLSNSLEESKKGC